MASKVRKLCITQRFTLGVKGLKIHFCPLSDRQVVLMSKSAPGNYNGMSTATLMRLISAVHVIYFGDIYEW